MRYHDEVKPYRCRFCSEGFRSKIALYDHIRVHTTLTGSDLENLINEQKLNTPEPVNICNVSICVFYEGIVFHGHITG